MKLEGVEVDNSGLCHTFAEFFDSKFNNIANSCKVEEDVYNGRKKLTTVNKNFNNPDNVMKALKSIKLKNSES